MLFMSTYVPITATYMMLMACNVVRGVACQTETIIAAAKSFEASLGYFKGYTLTIRYFFC